MWYYDKVLVIEDLRGAVAASPLGVPGQMLVNGALGGVQTWSMGGIGANISFSIGLGLFSGWLGGAGPSWKDTNVFLPRVTYPFNGAEVHNSLSTQFWHAFKYIWKGHNSDMYVTPQFGGILSGYLKGTTVSNIPVFLPGIIERIWEKYYIDAEDESESVPEEAVNEE